MRGGRKPMISFRKHALEGTRCPNSFLKRRPRRADTTSRVAVLILLLLAADANGAASTGQKGREKTRGEGHRAVASQTPARKAPGRGDESAGESKIPIRVTRVDTPEGPSVVATIGDFPADLNEGGQDFLKREFFEHFASDVLGLGDSESHATLKVALLPQEKENQREGDFTFGKLSGRMVVLVEKRRVMVACTFSEAESVPQLLAVLERLFAGGVSAV
ncbi:MAG: hypothetical protein QOH51_3927 [Acidobacteriota bacterium]|nr:hypothetical protein [Acidobacteriota bacterium]